MEAMMEEKWIVTDRNGNELACFYNFANGQSYAEYIGGCIYWLRA